MTSPSVAAPSRPPAGARQGTDRKQESANLDLLRSLALLWVLAVHLFGFLGVIPQGSSLMRVGQFGLRLFFVHTTLVLMRSLERRYRGEGWRDLFGNFLLRRCFRIYPLSVLIVLVTFAFRIPAANVGVWSIHHIAVGPGGLLANLLLVQNLTYTPSIVGQMWSLPLEMQMYVLLPALFLLARRATSVRPLLVLWVAAVGLAFVQPMISGRLSLGQFVPSFLPGIVAYRLAGTIRPRWPFVAWPLTLCALAAGFSLSLPEEHGWVLCLVTGLAIPRFKEPEQEWLRRGAQLVARYSYGIYLTHLFALWLAFVRLAAFPMAGRWVVFLGMLIALPVLLYHTLEAPMIASGARLADRWFARRASPAVAV